MPTDVDIEDLVEKKFRSLKLELKIIAFIVRRDHNVTYSLNRDFFTIEPYKQVYDIVKKNLMEFSQEILLEYIKKEFGKDKISIYKIYIEKIFKTDLKKVTNKNINKLVAKLGDYYESRVIMKSIGDVLSFGEEFNLEEAKKKLYNATMINTKRLIDTSLRGGYTEDYENRKKHLKEIQNNPLKLAGIPTGIRQFDELSGGLMKGECGIVLGGTGIGKTTSLIFFGVNAWLRGYNVLFVSIEMTKYQIGFRIDSRIARIPYSKFRRAEFDEKDYKRWESRMGKLKKMRDNVFEIVCLPRGCSALDVEREANRIQAVTGNKIDLIVIDYLNLMRVSHGKGKEHQKDWTSQSDVAWELKAMSVEYNNTGVAIWSANQITDEGAKAKKIETYHLKYGRAISEVMPVIISLNQGIDDQLEDIVKLWIVKCRDFQKIKQPIILHPRFEYMMMNYETVKTPLIDGKKL